MSSTTRIEARAAEWIAERDGDAWSHQRQIDLDAWLEESVAHRVAYLRLQAAWLRADRLRALRSAESSARPPFVAASEQSAPRARRLQAWGFASVVGIVVLGFALLAVGSLRRSGSPQVFATSIGARESVSLEDGSKLTLNTSTQLRAKISPSERVVWLDEGEAYFDVAHDTARPFVIIAGNRRVTVVGTKFSLRREGDRLKVDVVEGRVQVQAGTASPTVLSRGETAIGEGTNVLVSRRTERQSLAATSWLDGRLVFDQITIAEAATQFNRYNRKKLVIADAAAANVRIGGTFEADNAEGFARLMQAGFGLVVESHDDQIVMHSASR